MSLMTIMPAPGSAITPPDDFPVTFAPGEDGLLWDRDRSHFPGQLTTLEGDFFGRFVAHGMAHAFARYAVPLAGARGRAVNGYLYTAFVPLEAAPDDLAARAAESEAALRAVVGRLEDAWEEEWLPEITARLRAMEAADPRGVPSTVGLVDVLEGYWEHMERLWELHFEIVFAAYVAVSDFADLHRDLFGGDDFDAYRLLQGTPTRTFEVGCDLWHVSRVARRSPEVAAVLASRPARDLPAALEALPAGRAVLTQLDRHLAAFGHRTASWGLTTPSFMEDPTPVLQMLKDYAAQPDEASPGIELERQARERDAAVVDARRRLAGYPAPVVARFEALLAAAQTGLLLTEDHGFYIDAWSVSLVRELLSEMGTRLVADGLLDDPEDVLMLTYDELRVAALDLPGTDPRTARRRAPRRARRPRGRHAAGGARDGARGPAAVEPAAPGRRALLGRPRAGRRPGRRHRRAGLVGARHRRRPRGRLARRGGPAGPGRRPRRGDDRAAVDAAVRARRRGGHGRRRHPQPRGRRRSRVRDPGGGRRGQCDGDDQGRRPRRGRRRRRNRADPALILSAARGRA